MSSTADRCEPCPDFPAFVLAHGRFPAIGDAVPPWHYRGWLLGQVRYLDYHPQLPGRWRHWNRTMEAGHLLDDPIPRIDFENSANPQGLKVIERSLEILFHAEGSWGAFRRLVEWLAWGLAVSKEKPPLAEDVNETLYRQFNLEPLLLRPYDYLGSILAERQGNGFNPNAFYPTPHAIVEMMIQMTMRDLTLPDGRDTRLATLMEPCVGTGRFLLHASNYSYCLYGQDVDGLVVMITKINGALYAPWLSFPFPASVLGIPVPPPPPALLPVPEQDVTEESREVFRCDDRGQGLLDF